MNTRRSFLRGLGLVSIPLVGGGVTLIGKAAATPVPLMQVAAAPLFGDPRERARYAWEALSAAMREMTADTHGWHVRGGESLPFGYMKGGSYLVAESRQFLAGTEPRAPKLIVEEFREIDLTGGAA